MKYCEDCKHFRYSSVGKGFHRCAASPPNIITRAIDMRYCEDQRRGGGACGVEAKKFEQREPTWWETTKRMLIDSLKGGS